MLNASRKSKKKTAQVPASYSVKKGDTVMVVAGKDRGKTGTVQHVFRSRGKVLVEGLNLVKKAVRPNPMLGQRGGIVEMEAPLHVSKVMVYDAKASKPTRVGTQVVDGKRVRVSKKSGEQLD